MPAIREDVQRCGTCGEEKAQRFMAVGNLCLRCSREGMTIPSGSPLAKWRADVLQCQDCRERKTAPAFVIPGLCQRCIIAQLEAEPEELADEAGVSNVNVDIAGRSTAAVLELLEGGNLPPWRRGFEYAKPRNGITERQYQGTNYWTTLTEQMLNGWKDSRWLTENQTRKAGGRVKDGEIPTDIHFSKFQPRVTGDGKMRLYIFRTHRIYNVEQTEGVDFTMMSTFPQWGTPPSNSVEEAERIIDEMPNKPAIHRLPVMTHPARYWIVKDLIEVPQPELFDSWERYYETMFHELSHSTGHTSRLGRFGDDSAERNLHEYGLEELIAEMTAAMLCDKAGIGQETLGNAAAYIKSWRDTIKADLHIFMQASHAAQKALDYISPPDGGRPGGGNG